MPKRLTAAILAFAAVLALSSVALGQAKPWNNTGRANTPTQQQAADAAAPGPGAPAG